MRFSINLPPAHRSCASWNTIRSSTISFQTVVAALLLGSAFSCGCGGEPEKPLPVMYEVSGTVADKAGEPATAGMLEFRSTAGAERSAQADVQSDGQFSLFTMVGGQKISGAVPGEYRVTYYPQMSASQSELPVTIDESFVVEKKENAFEIRLK